MGVLYKTQFSIIGRSRRLAFTNPVRHRMVRGAPAHLESFVASLLLVSDMRFGNIADQFGELNIISLIGSQSSKD